jgi:hypothetical protein
MASSAKMSEKQVKKVGLQPELSRVADGKCMPGLQIASSAMSIATKAQMRRMPKQQRKLSNYAVIMVDDEMSRIAHVPKPKTMESSRKMRNMASQLCKVYGDRVGPAIAEKFSYRYDPQTKKGMFTAVGMALVMLLFILQPAASVLMDCAEPKLSQPATNTRFGRLYTDAARTAIEMNECTANNQPLGRSFFIQARGYAEYRLTRIRTPRYVNRPDSCQSEGSMRHTTGTPLAGLTTLIHTAELDGWIERSPYTRAEIDEEKLPCYDSHIFGVNECVSMVSTDQTEIEELCVVALTNDSVNFYSHHCLCDTCIENDEMRVCYGAGKLYPHIPTLSKMGWVPPFEGRPFEEELVVQLERGTLCNEIVSEDVILPRGEEIFEGPLVPDTEGARSFSELEPTILVEHNGTEIPIWMLFDVESSMPQIANLSVLQRFNLIGSVHQEGMIVVDASDQLTRCTLHENWYYCIYQIHQETGDTFRFATDSFTVEGQGIVDNEVVQFPYGYCAIRIEATKESSETLTSEALIVRIPAGEFPIHGASSLYEIYDLERIRQRVVPPSSVIVSPKGPTSLLESELLILRVTNFEYNNSLLNYEDVLHMEERDRVTMITAHFNITCSIFSFHHREKRGVCWFRCTVNTDALEESIDTRFAELRRVTTQNDLSVAAITDSLNSQDQRIISLQSDLIEQINQVNNNLGSGLLQTIDQTSANTQGINQLREQINQAIADAQDSDLTLLRLIANNEAAMLDLIDDVIQDVIVVTENGIEVVANTTMDMFELIQQTIVRLTQVDNRTAAVIQLSAEAVEWSTSYRDAVSETGDNLNRILIDMLAIEDSNEHLSADGRSEYFSTVTDLPVQAVCGRRERRQQISEPSCNDLITVAMLLPQSFFYCCDSSSCIAVCPNSLSGVVPNATHVAIVNCNGVSVTNVGTSSTEETFEVSPLPEIEMEVDELIDLVENVNQSLLETVAMTANRSAADFRMVMESFDQLREDTRERVDNATVDLVQSIFEAAQNLSIRNVTIIVNDTLAVEGVRDRVEEGINSVNVELVTLQNRVEELQNENRILNEQIQNATRQIILNDIFLQELFNKPLGKAILESDGDLFGFLGDLIGAGKWWIWLIVGVVGIVLIAIIIMILCVVVRCITAY